MAWIQTFTGKKFSLTDPQPEDVDIRDIIAALCKIVRFNGHCRHFYSVAQHSIHVSELVPIKLRYDALLHDAPEAYYGDLTRPLKQVLYPLTCGALKQLLHRIDLVVYDALGVTNAHHADVKRADNVMLATEARDLLGTPPEAWAPLPPPREEKLWAWNQEMSKGNFEFAYEHARPK